MRGKRRATLGAVAIAALALAATAPGAAAAGFGMLSYRGHGPVDARVDDETTVTASCRPGSYVIGGGQQVKADARNAMVHSSSPYDGPDADTIPDDGWRSRVDSFNGAQNSVTEYAICTTKQPHYRQDGFAVGEGGGYGLVQPRCPTRETALGGGIDVSPGYGNSAVLMSIPGRPAPTGSWEGRAIVGMTSVPNERMTGWIICGKAAVTYPTASGQVASGGSGRASAACPAATSLIGGGVLAPEGKFTPEDVRPTTFGPLDGRDGDLVPDDRWGIEADDWGTTGSTIEATAVCLH